MSASRKLVHELVLGIGLDTTTTSAVGTAAAAYSAAQYDRYNSGNPVHELVALIDVGTWTTDGVVTFTLEHSDTSGSGFAAVPAGKFEGTAVVSSAATDDTQYLLGYNGDKRYVRVNVGIAGQTTGGLANIVVWYAGANPRDMITVS